MLSILVPIYNHNVTQLISDLHRQATDQFIDFEIIAFEDGSVLHYDQNKAICQKLNCRHIASEKNIGRSASRNLHPREARYDHLLFMDCNGRDCSEHFNEKYVESDQFPKATFKGNIVNFKDVNLKKDGVYKVKITGEMTIHGVTKTVKADGTLEVKAAKIIGLSTFKLPLKDYNINVPSVVSDKIASEMTIKVQMDYSELKK